MRVSGVLRTITDRLCTRDPQWENSELVGETAIWKDTGILRPTGRYDVVRCTCGEPHVAEVEEGRRPDGSRGPIAFCTYTGHSFPVAPEDLISYTFDPNKMVEILSELLACRQEPTIIIPGRLWKMGKSGVAIGGRSRDVYFAPRLTKDAQEIYDQLPEAKTPLLIVGSSRFLKDTRARIDDNRIINLDAILQIEGGEWRLDRDWLNTLAADEVEDESSEKRRECTAITIENLKKPLLSYLQSAYRNYCDRLEHDEGEQMPKSRLTCKKLSEMSGVSSSWVSKLLELKKPVEECKYPELRCLWEATQDLDQMKKYGKKHWGKRWSARV